MRTLSITAAALAIATATIAAATPPRYAPWGIVYADMDKSVRPGDDFFQHAEGHWLATTPIPADKTSTGFNYTLPDEIETQLRTIVDDAAKRPSDPIAQQIGDFYAAWMDEATLEARGLKPLRPVLAQIAAVQDVHGLVRVMAQPGFPEPVNVGIAADDKDPQHYIISVTQAQLGLPTRDYYLLQGAKYEAYRKAYRAHIAQIFTLLGQPDADKRAAAVLDLETRISQGQWTPEARRDPVKAYNPMGRAGLAKLAPQFDWQPVLQQRGFGAMPKFVVGEPSAVVAAGRLLTDAPLSAWKDWVTFRFVSDHAAYLPHAFDQAHFDFYSKTMRDVPEQRARWKRGIALVDGNLGEALGELYVREHWSDETRAKVDEMMSDIRWAYGEAIRGATWMDEPTRKVALEKLAAFDPRTGHPVHWIDYSSLKVGRSTLFENMRASEDFEHRRELQLMVKPVDRTLWYMTPQTVNAYYDPTQNQVTVPAAILQPPFFDANADAAVNYAMTGATTIGHEMGHGFDDQGRQYDPHGKLTDWWTPTAVARYKVKADALSAQFDQYEPLPGTHIKGQLTLGENLADLGGLETAYRAYRRYVARHGDTVIDGYTSDQRFFLAFAQAWQGKRREGAAREQLLLDPHSPEKYRVNGIVRNFDPWYVAFDVKPGEKLYLPPAQRVHVWN
jgi:endothelin-converting enzyme/putative endopeptidase